MLCARYNYDKSSDQPKISACVRLVHLARFTKNKEIANFHWIPHEAADGHNNQTTLQPLDNMTSIDRFFMLILHLLVEELFIKFKVHVVQSNFACIDNCKFWKQLILLCSCIFFLSYVQILYLIIKLLWTAWKKIGPYLISLKSYTENIIIIFGGRYFSKVKAIYVNRIIVNND